MTALEIFFTVLAVLGFGATTWIAGIVLWRLLKAPRR